MRDTFRIGRRQPRGPMVPACTLRFKEGAILFENEDDEHGPSTAERRMILGHFASPIIALKGESDGIVFTDTKVEIPPGTLEHFNHAAYQVPLPFGRYPIGGA